jgi:hypothetical protein
LRCRIAATQRNLAGQLEQTLHWACLFAEDAWVSPFHPPASGPQCAGAHGEDERGSVNLIPGRLAHPERGVWPGHGGRPGPQAAAVTLLAGLAVLAGLVAGCASGPARGSAAPPGTATPRAAARTASASPAAASTPGTPRPGSSPSVIAVPPPPASLPQTMAFPRADGAVFHAEMTDLWAAVVAGRPALARDAFFPISAYQQVKAIFDPAADWHDRLWGDFRLDVAAAHGLLGPDGGQAALVRVIVPSQQASWIVPGVCSNRIGYWHAAGARVVYRLGGQLRSFGIASLISWRGRWYVVHFGAVLRNAAVGLVDQPSAGPGVPGPPGGC